MGKKIVGILLIVLVMIGTIVTVSAINKGSLFPEFNGGTQVEEPSEEPGNNEQEQPEEPGESGEPGEPGITLDQDYIYF